MAITKVFLLSVPLEKDYAHTLYFENKTAQNTYFQGRVRLKYEDFTYQRKDGVIRIPDQIDTLWKQGVNYVMYQNPDYNDKWFYAFITDMQYINDGRTDITIQTDCLQTWMFEKVMKPCFIEREHTENDTPGENTVPEGLETGEFVANRHTRSQYANSLSIVFAVTAASGDGNPLDGRFVNGHWSGVCYAVFDGTPSNQNATNINNFVKRYAESKETTTDAIISMFICPTRMLTLTPGGPEGEGWEDYVKTTMEVDKKFINGESAEISVGFSTLSLDGYTPRNKKLMAFPYRYLLASNNNGGSVVYHYEQFYKKDAFGKKTIVTNPEFVIEGVVCPGCSIRMIPMDYKGIQRNDDEGINMGKFPILNWASDEYTNWLTQNGVNIALEVAAGVGQIVAGAAAAAATGGAAAAIGAGLASGGVSTIANTLAQVHTQSFTPPQARGNINAGDVITAAGQNDFHFYDMTVKKEYAQILDEYFDMYGYKTHRVKIPAQNHRANYWFTKTIDANITGEIPQNDLQTIKDCYNRGVTYWRKPENFKNYTADNGIVYHV